MFGRFGGLHFFVGSREHYADLTCLATTVTHERQHSTVPMLASEAYESQARAPQLTLKKPRQVFKT